MSRPTLACAAACALVAALLVAGSAPGLGLTLALLLAAATAAVAGPAHGAASDDPAARRRHRRAAGPLLLAAGLAAQPTLRDAGPVVAVGVLGALLAAAWAAAPAASWAALARTAVAPLRLDAGVLLLSRTVAPALRRVPTGALAPAARGAVAALVVGGVFCVLLGTADEAFAQLAGDVLAARPDAGTLPARLLLGALGAATAGALAFAHLRRPAVARPGPPPPRTELLAVLLVLVALFALFVVVQLRVLFGGAGYVQRTTGLGYGEYARSGFVALLAVAALTLGVVAVAARRRDRLTRGLLGALCVCTLVMLASAAHRLGLVEDAYGLTRVRAGGEAVVVWLVLVLLVVLAAGAHRRAGRLAPAALLTVTLATAFGFCVSDPDRRIAERALDRGDRADLPYLAGLSADALPALRRLEDPGPARAVAARAHRPAGIGGLNRSRAR